VQFYIKIIFTKNPIAKRSQFNTTNLNGEYIYASIFQNVWPMAPLTPPLAPPLAPPLTPPLAPPLAPPLTPPLAPPLTPPLAHHCLRLCFFLHSIILNIGKEKIIYFKEIKRDLKL
jgi:hypothetical protein